MTVIAPFRRAIRALAVLVRARLGSGNRIVVGSLLLCAINLSGCEATGGLDVFKRPITPENSMPVGPMGGCDRRAFDEPPTLLSGARPPYPMAEEMHSNEGTATIRFVVTVDGHAIPTESAVEGASWFASHARYAMSGWKFKPAVRGGLPVESTCTSRFAYTMRK